MMACKICGCTEQHACVDERGERENCSWASPGLCSFCADSIKQLKPFIDAVKELRATQISFFRTRSQAFLAKSKNLEKKLDDVLTVL